MENYMFPDMSIFIGPQNRQVYIIAGSILLAIIIFMAIYFFLARIRKIHHIAGKNPQSAYKYNGFLLFLDYIFYALIAFIGTTLLAGAPLAAIVYLAVWLTQGEAPFVPLFSIALGFGIFMGIYGTFMFLRSKVIHEESRTVKRA
jgi:hypothetical protein